MLLKNPGTQTVLNFRCGYMFSGGTVDITVHEVLDDGNVRELYKANGGPWGGKSVNDAFLHFLGGLFVCSGCIV